jgi:large subunit ribosomal protein L7Ae
MPAKTTTKTTKATNTAKTTKSTKPQVKKTTGGVQKKSQQKKILYKALFQPKPRIFGIGQAKPPKLDLTRFVKWPKYVRLQRQRRILSKRLKVPPAIAQFSRAASKPLAAKVLKFLNKYRPEDARMKKERLRAAAKERVKGKQQKPATKPNIVAYGLNRVVNLVERKKAELVVIAHDVEPIELVLFLPALCNKMNIPYVIVKSKSRLGQVIHQDKTCALAVTSVNKEDREEFNKLIEAVRGAFNEKYAGLAVTARGGKSRRRGPDEARTQPVAV